LIVFGAYGGGHNPVITGRDHGVTSSAGRQYIRLQDLQIRHTEKEAIYPGQNSDHWSYDRLNLDDIGGGFWLVNVNDHTIENSTVSDSSQEGVWGWNVDGLKVENTAIGPGMTGKYTDGIQFEGVRNYSIRNNTIDMRGTDSDKGGFIAQSNDAPRYQHNPGTNVIENNAIIGGNYGIAGGDSNVLIKNNHLIGHNANDWSSDIMYRESDNENMGALPVVHDIRIIENFLENSRNGIQLWGIGKRRNIQVHGNVIGNVERPINRNGDASYTDVSITANTIWTPGHPEPLSPLKGPIGALPVPAPTSSPTPAGSPPRSVPDPN
jgi:hypothetical protein